MCFLPFKNCYGLRDAADTGRLLMCKIGSLCLLLHTKEVQQLNESSKFAKCRRKAHEKRAIHLAPQASHEYNE
jgi:hypothetical protein